MSDNPFLLPPGPESATHRIARPAPDSASAIERPAPVAEETRLAPAVAARTWALTLPDGTRIPLTGSLLLGRNPAAIPDRPEAQLFALADPGKTVSKTHALLEPAPGGVRIRELHSTNGTAVDIAGARHVVDTGGETVAPAGSTILLGSFPIGVAAS